MTTDTCIQLLGALLQQATNSRRPDCSHQSYTYVRAYGMSDAMIIYTRILATMVFFIDDELLYDE
jgi:hypothetical protein